MLNKEMKSIFKKIETENKHACIIEYYNVNTYKVEHKINQIFLKYDYTKWI